MKWIKVEDEYPEQNVKHVLVYTPGNDEITYRIMPVFMFGKNTEWTHWSHLEKPEEL